MHRKKKKKSKFVPRCLVKSIKVTCLFVCFLIKQYLAIILHDSADVQLIIRHVRKGSTCFASRTKETSWGQRGTKALRTELSSSLKRSLSLTDLHAIVLHKHPSVFPLGKLLSPQLPALAHLLIPHIQTSHEAQVTSRIWLYSLLIGYHQYSTVHSDWLSAG